MHPLRCKAIASAQLKNDKVDAAILAQMLRADLHPEEWIVHRTCGRYFATASDSMIRMGAARRRQLLSDAVSCRQPSA